MSSESESRSRIFLIAIVIVALAGAGGWYLFQKKDNDLDFTLADIDGNVVSLKDLEGQVVVLDFMATWCGPCKISMSVLVPLHEEIGENFVLISIAVDPSHDKESTLRDWIDIYGANWSHVRDVADPPLTQRFEVTAVPTIVIINKKGEISYKHLGLVSESKLRQEILSLVQ
jgi:thiol-disulfide isomerase/thioredoxin